MEDRLYKFSRLVDAGSFTKAASLMHISQPALTTAIKKLERELQAELLIRGSHTFRLTAAGSLAYSAAKEMELKANNLKLHIAESSGQKIVLRIGMIDGLASLLFVRGNNLQSLEQSTHLSLTVDNSSRLIRYIEHDELDIALIAKPTSLPKTLETIDLGQEPMVIVAHTEQTKQVKTDLANSRLQHFLGYNQNSHTYRLVRQHLENLGVSIQHTFYSTSPEIMLELALNQRGVAALPYLLVKPYLKQGSLTLIAVNDSRIIARTIVGLHRSGRALPKTTTDLLAKTKTELSQLMQQAKDA